MFNDLVCQEGAGLLHDFELAYIIADYRNKQVIIQLKSPCSSLITHELKLFGVQHFQMQFTEPWGKGMYVAATDIERKGSLQFMEMRLNSGDLVTAEFEHAEFDGE